MSTPDKYSINTVVPITSSDDASVDVNPSSVKKDTWTLEATPLLHSAAAADDTTQTPLPLTPDPAHLNVAQYPTPHGNGISTSTLSVAGTSEVAPTTPGASPFPIPSKVEGGDESAALEKSKTLMRSESSATRSTTLSAHASFKNKMGKAPGLPSRSKMMALTGEMLPSNALDPTGYERRDDDEKKDKIDQDTIDALKDGLIELDAFGQPIYKNFQSRIKLTLRKKFRGCWKVYDPASTNRQYWSLLVVGFLLYGMIEIPIRVGFEVDVVPWSGPDIFNLFVDIFFLVDVFMNFRTGFYQEDNRLVLDEKKIALQYLKSWFTLDVITSIPISQIMQLAFHGDSTSGLAALSLPRLLRVFRIARLFKILRMLKLMNVMSNWSESSNEKLFSLMMKVMKFVTLIFLLSHLSGCIWGWIALQQKDENQNFNVRSWPYRYGIYNYSDTTWSHMYLLSLYWALCTLTTLGYGDIHPGTGIEYAFCIVLTFIGTCCFGYIIGTISSILKHGKETETLYLNKMTELNLYMSYRKITPFLQKKIRKHYEYLYRRQTLYNEAEILQELPNYLRSDLSVYLYKDLIEKVPFLADMGPDCAMLVILKLKPLQFSPGGFIFTKGALGREMFFVSKGIVEVVNGNGLIICQLKEGSYFGEYAILSEKPVYRTASIRARTFVDLLSLSKNDFELIWSLYPEIYAKIIRRAQEQWQQAIQDNKVGGLDAAAAADINKSRTPIAADSKRFLKKTKSSANGDTVIRIDKTDATIGQDAKRSKSIAGKYSSVDASDDEAGTVTGDETDMPEFDDDICENSYIDSLEGLESENDEDYDEKLDAIDLPDHLLPPPKPRIVGSLLSKAENAEGGGGGSSGGNVSRSNTIKGTKLNRLATKTSASQKLVNDDNTKVTPAKSTAFESGKPSVELITVARPSTSNSGDAASMATATDAKDHPAAISAQPLGAVTPSKNAVPRAASNDNVDVIEGNREVGDSKLIADAANSDGEDSRPQSRAELLSGSDDDVSRVALLKKQHLKNGKLPTVSRRPSGIRLPLTSENTNTNQITNDAVASAPSSPVISTYNTPVVAAVSKLSPTAAAVFDLDGTSNNTNNAPLQPSRFATSIAAATAKLEAYQSTQASSDQEWSASTTSSGVLTTIESVLTTSLQPIQSQYQRLLVDHASLQEKQKHTEKIIRALVAKLHEERAETARLKASSSPTEEKKVTNGTNAANARRRSQAGSMGGLGASVPTSKGGALGSS